MPPRALATATVSFGLVSIPVKLYTPVRSSEKISFRQLHKDCGERLKQQMVCPKHENRVVGRDETARGYEYAKDRFVVLSEDEYESALAQTTRAIEIREFVPASQVDPVFFDKPYYLGPEPNGLRPYLLLAEAMRKTGLAGVAQYAARGKEYLVLLRATAEGLVMQQLHYANELRAFAEVEVPAGELNAAELELALQIVRMKTAAEFQPEKYEDNVRAQLDAIIARKLEGAEVTMSAAAEPEAQIIDLMAALKASLAAHQSTARDAAPKARASGE